MFQAVVIDGLLSARREVDIVSCVQCYRTIVTVDVGRSGVDVAARLDRDAAIGIDSRTNFGLPFRAEVVIAVINIFFADYHYVTHDNIAPQKQSSILNM